MKKNSSKSFDFTKPTGLTPEQVVIIEQNLDTQVNYTIGYTTIIWNLDGTPAKIEKYEDDTLANKLFTITPSFISGYIDTVTVVNEDDKTTTTKQFTWSNGNLDSVKVIQW